MANVVWYLEDGNLTHDDLAKMVDYSFDSPLPAVWWSVENGVLTTAVLPPADTHEHIEWPFPMNVWYINERNMFTHAGLPEEVPTLGAFSNAENLVTVEIPLTTTSIGDQSFTNTQLTSVKISADCTYNEQTSFPEGCEVTRYT